MNEKRMRLLSLLYVVVVGANAISRQLGQQLRAEHEASDKEYDFPRVYTATIPSPPNPEGRKFIAELDVLDIEKNVDLETVTFMVHGPQELRHVKEVSSKLTTELDMELIRTYNKKAEQSIGRVAGAQNTSYSTIEGFPCYRNLAGMEQLMLDLVEQAKSIPNLEVTLTDIGDSYMKTQNSTEGFDIWALKITGSGAQPVGIKGVMFVLTGIHAREYSPPELAARFAEMLVSLYGHDADVTAMLDHTEIHLVLHSNPDGRYEAEVLPDLYRRKNMNGNTTLCDAGEWGVDLNRNFPFRWGLDSGSSSFPCSAIYRGESPASEPEVKAIINYLSEIFPEEQRKVDPEVQIDEAYPQDVMGIFFDIHSYGEIIIWPWGHENKKTANHRDLQSLVRKYRHFNGYEFSGPNTTGFSYEASGTTDDFSFGVLGVPGMTVETGTAFFETCDYFIDSVLPSNIPTLMYAAKLARAPYLLSKGPDVTSLMVWPENITNSAGSVLNVTANVSDSALSFGNFSTSQQSISSVQLFIDSHPYDADLLSGLEMRGSFNSDSETVTVSLSLNQILQEITLPVVGRHTVFVQGTDSDGYTGPVAAAFFYIEKSPDEPDDVDPPGDTDEEVVDSPDYVDEEPVDDSSSETTLTSRAAVTPAAPPSVCHLALCFLWVIELISMFLLL